jgi:predicted transcriptional regulator
MITKREIVEELDLMIANGFVEIVEGFGDEAKYMVTEKGMKHLEYLKDEQG